MEISEWLKQTWWLLGIIAALFTYLAAITTGGGKFGRWARSKIIGNMEHDMQAFMSEHEGCKPNTERELKRLSDENAELKRKISRIEEILANDLSSFRLIFRILDISLDHEIYGNHMEQIRQAKDDLHQHVINR